MRLPTLAFLLALIPATTFAAKPADTVSGQKARAIIDQRVQKYRPAYLNSTMPDRGQKLVTRVHVLADQPVAGKTRVAVEILGPHRARAVRVQTIDNATHAVTTEDGPNNSIVGAFHEAGRRLGRSNGPGVPRVTSLGLSSNGEHIVFEGDRLPGASTVPQILRTVSGYDFGKIRDVAPARD